MKISIIGAGGVGGFFGAKFALSGQDVVFICRGKNLEVCRKNGLTLESEGSKFIIKDAIFSDDYKEIEGSDYIIVTVKSYDTDIIAEQIKPYINPNTLIITIQNGIDNDLKLASALNSKNVLPGFARVAASTPEPGVVQHTSMGIIVLGEYNGEISERLKTFSTYCEKAGIQCDISKDILKERWNKYIWNCTYNIISAIYRKDLREILADKELNDLSINTMKELYAIAKLEGHDFNLDEAIKSKLEYTYNLGPFKTSTLQDVEKGKPLEIEAFTGYILKLAKKHNIKLPINEALYKLVQK